MFRSLLAAAALLLLGAFSPACAGALDDCSAQLPFGKPAFAPLAPAPHAVTFVCHKAYVLAHDDEKLVPRWVAYTLTGEHAIGCLGRSDAFQPDPDLPKGHRAEMADYLRSGYDRGHMAPDGDFRWDDTAEHQSFYLSNMAPQIHELNAGLWERLEAETRVWATDRGEVAVIDGPLFGVTPATIGPHHVPVPMAFFKVISDVRSGDTLAFVMPHKPLGLNEDLSAYLVPVAAVEDAAGIAIPLPPGVERSAKGKLWDADLASWQRKKLATCHASH